MNHVTTFTNTGSYVDGDEMVFSWVRQREGLVLHERNKCSLPRNGLLRGTVDTKMYCSHWECSHPRGKWPKKQHR
jgi:hypothetical protein